MNQPGPPSLAALAPLVVQRPSLDLGAPAAATLEGAIRSCMTAIALGGFEERGNVPVAADLGHLLAANPSRDVLHAMGDAVLLGTLGAATDLDPLDSGP